MRILTITNLFPPSIIGGYELGCAQAVAALRRRGHEVLVLTAVGAPRPDEAGVDRSLHLVDVYDQSHRARSGDLEWMLREAQGNIVDSENVSRVATVVEGFKPDVAYLWNLVGVGGLGVVGILQHLGVAWTWHLMDCVPRSLCTIGGRVVAGLATSTGPLLEGRYISCSRSLVTEIEEGGIQLPGDIHEISNWIDGDRPQGERTYYRGGHLRVAFAGQIARHKGVHIIIEMASVLRDWGFTNFSVDLFGQSLDEHASQVIDRFDVHGLVRLAGARRQDELVNLYRDYDLFVFPTWSREPYGFAPLEAQARGCVPLVSADCGYSEWFVNGVHCIKAERNVADFADTVRMILEQRIDLEPIARRGADVAWRDFHINTIVPRIEAVLEASASSHPSVAGTAEDGYRLARMAEQIALSAITDASRPTAAAGAQ